jgi:hypothetical protein
MDDLLKISQHGTGKTGAGRPSIIWNAGIMGSSPAMIEIPGASATTARRKHG